MIITKVFFEICHLQCKSCTINFLFKIISFHYKISIRDVTFFIMDKIIQIFNPIQKTFKFFGFLPFKISTRGVQKSYLSIFYSSFLAILFSHEAYVRIINTNNFGLEGSPLSKITLSASFALSASFFISVIFLSYWNRHEFFKLIRIFVKFNRKVRKYKLMSF